MHVQARPEFRDRDVPRPPDGLLHHHRQRPSWNELLAAQHREAGTVRTLDAFTESLGGVEHCFVNELEPVIKMRLEGYLCDYRALVEEVFTYAQAANGKLIRKPWRGKRECPREI